MATAAVSRAEDVPASRRWIAFAFLMVAEFFYGWSFNTVDVLHLRSTAMSIFHWGRIISMTAPLITGAIAEAFGLPAAMTMSAVGLIVGGIVWLMIPETVVRRENARVDTRDVHAC